MQKDVKKIKFPKKKLKIAILNIFVLAIALFMFFVIGEVIARIIIGEKLSFQFEKDGFYYPKPDQVGWQHTDAVFNKARINNIGARGMDINKSLTSYSKKYIFLGDSFTFGWLLKDNETIPEYFKNIENLTNEHVINYGIPGYGIDHMIRNYDYHSNISGSGDNIILILIDQDFIRPLTPPSKNLVKVFFHKIEDHSSFISYTYGRLGPLFYRIKDGLGVQPKKEGIYFDERGFEKILYLEDKIHEKNQNLIVVFYEYNTTTFSEKSYELCLKHNLSCITNVPSFIKNINSNDSVYAVDGGHPSPYSNKLVAEGIANFIKYNNLSIQ